MSSSNYLFFRQVIAPVIKILLRKMFVFGIPVLIPVLRFRTLKYRNTCIEVLTGTVSPVS
jgi:hypothetical protein